DLGGVQGQRRCKSVWRAMGGLLAGFGVPDTCRGPGWWRGRSTRGRVLRSAGGGGGDAVGRSAGANVDPTRQDDVRQTDRLNGASSVLLLAEREPFRAIRRTRSSTAFSLLVA